MCYDRNLRGRTVVAKVTVAVLPVVRNANVWSSILSIRRELIDYFSSVWEKFFYDSFIWGSVPGRTGVASSHLCLVSSAS